MSFTVARALSDPRLLGAALGDPASWASWLAVLKAAHGLPLDATERVTFDQVAGGRVPPTKRVRELWAVIGRRAGKSRMAAAVAVYTALFTPHKLAAGETGYVLILAATVDQAANVLDYVKGFIAQSEALRGEVIGETQTEVRLRNNIIIASHVNSFRTIRGKSLVCCIFDEVSIWKDESSAAPDVETLRACAPSLLASGGLLVAISTPYRRAGLLFTKHRDYFGKPDSSVLVVEGPSVSFNPLLDPGEVARAIADDPTGARPEWEGVFRDDLALFLDGATIERAIDRDRPMELPAKTSLKYTAFVDVSGGQHDAFGLVIGHKAGAVFVADAVRVWESPFDPSDVVPQVQDVLGYYRVHEVRGDEYSANWAKSAFKERGVRYIGSDYTKNECFLESLPMFSRGLVRIPEHAKLLNELRLLELTVHRSGRDTVSKPKRNGSDDVANALCGWVAHAATASAYDPTLKRYFEDEDGPVGPDENGISEVERRRGEYRDKNGTLMASMRPWMPLGLFGPRW